MKENRQARETAIQSQEKKRRRSGKAKKEGKESQSLECQKKTDLSAFVASVVVGRVPEKGSAGKFGMHLQLAHEKNAMCAL